MEASLLAVCFVALSCHAFLLPIFGTGQHPFPRTFLFFQRVQSILVIATCIHLVGWIFGGIIGVILALSSASLFYPMMILLHLMHGVNLLRQPIVDTKFEWDSYSTFVNFGWTLLTIPWIVLLVMGFVD